MNTLTLPLSLFRRLLQTRLADRQSLLFLRTGTHRRPDRQEWLGRDLVSALPDATALAGEGLWQVLLRPQLPTGDEEVAWLAALPAPVSGLLVFVGDGAAPQIWGATRQGGQTHPVQQLSLVGAGMHRIPAWQIPPLEPYGESTARLPPLPYDRWSRTIGALGSAAAWQRLVALHAAIIGCSRSGEKAAGALARLGFSQLTLIDPDRLETHNLGEMDGVTEADVGRPKAEALADHLRAQMPQTAWQLTIHNEPIIAPAALAAARQADVIFCCVDNDAARVVVGLIATAYHRALVDLGTGIFAPEQTATSRPALRTMAADVRLIVPGDGCLLCRGQVTDYDRALRDLFASRVSLTPSHVWQRQRAGSLHTLNQLTVALGIHMLQELVAERISGTTWAQLSFDANSRLAVRYIDSPPAGAPCELCARAGLGDLALRRGG